MQNPKQNKEALGKGIRSLLQSIDTDLKTTTGNLKSAVVENATGINQYRLTKLKQIPSSPGGILMNRR